MKTKIDNDGAAFQVADEIVSLNNAQTKLKADMEAELAEVRARYAPTLEQLKGSIEEKTNALKNYCRRDAVKARLFPGEARSVDCTVARFGFRDSAPALKPLDSKAKMDDVARELHAKGNTQFIILPEPQPVIDKAAIMAANLTPGALADLGLRIVIPTTFFVEQRDKVITGAATVKAS